MQDAIEKAYLAGKWEWPSVSEQTLDNYAKHVRELRTSDADLERHGADLYLALGCGRNDPEALRVLEESFLPGLHTHLSRSGFDQTFREDVLQQLLLHLCTGDKPRILTYAARATLAAWLRVVTLRFAINMKQGGQDAPKNGHDLGLSCLVSDDANPELRLAIESARPLFQTALTQAMSKLSDRDTTLLRLFFLDGVTIDGVGQLYGVHRATAARWIAEIRQRILENIKRVLTQEFGVNASEFESFAFLVRSQLHLSLRRVLGAA
jgi:RNA polymerase sigma-70 factor, ECF subfamily